MSERVLTRIGLLAVLLLCQPAAHGAEPLTVAVATEVALSPAAAWNRLQDFSAADKYVPGLTRTDIMSSQRSGVGAHRRVYDAEGEFLEETVTEWREGQGFTIRLHRGAEPMAPFKSAQFNYQLVPAADGNTRVELSLTALMPMGSVGATLGDWIVRPAMEEELVAVAAGLKHYYETGEPATDSDRARLAAQVEVLPAAGDD